MFKEWFKRRAKGASDKSSPAAPMPVGGKADQTDAQQQLIAVYDAYGREVRILREDWREKVLKPNLAAARDKPDELYRLCVSALQDGLVDDVDEASIRLLEIDPIAERSHCLRGIVLLKSGRLDAAESVLQEGMRRAGRTGALLTNLAKVRADRGDQGAAEQLLWDALQADPNQDNGLVWWAAIHRERGGEAGYLAALERVATLPDSWRAQLWIARALLAQGNVAGAMERYRTVLAAGNYSDDALMMMSGDLGNHGQVALIPELIAPVFDPVRHDPRAGLNLLQAYLQLRRREDGEQLLQRMYARQLAPYKHHLDRLAAEFAALPAGAPDVPESAPDEPVTLEVAALEGPIWTYSLRAPDWLFPPKSKEAPPVIFVSFSRDVPGDSRGGSQREDDGGRMTRAIPLYLAEAVHSWTTFGSRTLIPVVRDSGPAIFPAGNDEALCRQFGDQGAYLVSGNLDDRSDAWKVSFRLWRTEDCAVLAEETAETTPQDIGTAVLALEQSLLRHLGHSSGSPTWPFYTRPSAEGLRTYLIELGQSLMLTLIANEYLKPTGLWGERNMLEWPLNMALQWPNAQVPPLMYLSGLAKAKGYGSKLLPEFRERTFQLLKDVQRRNGVAAKLEPLAWMLFGMDEELRRFQAQVDDAAPAGYREWLQRLTGDEVKASRP